MLIGEKWLNTRSSQWAFVLGDSMADNVKWIKFILGCTDGRSFKKMRKAIIGGVNYRDKLEAVWFELLDFAGQCNREGAFIDEREIPYKSLEDIACMINRETDELELCMQFYVQEGMVEIIDDIYKLSNWHKYQNNKYFTDKREYDKLKQREYRERKRLNAEEHKLLVEKENVNDKSMTNVKSFSYSNSISNNINNIVSIEEINNYFDKIYSIYPRKVSKVQAKETFEHKLRGLEKEEAYKKAIAVYRMLENQNQVWQAENDGQGRKVEFISHFSTWLNDNVENSPHFKKGRKR